MLDGLVIKVGNVVNVVSLSSVTAIQPVEVVRVEEAVITGIAWVNVLKYFSMLCGTLCGIFV